MSAAIQMRFHQLTQKNSAMNISIRFIAFSALMLISATTHAETTLCTPVVPPATINKPGSYCLTQDYVVEVGDTRAAIQINTNNVVLDLNGHRIVNASPSLGTSTTGIRSGEEEETVGRHTVTIRNGVIRGFTVGVMLSGSASKNSRVEDMLVDRSSYAGISVFGTQMIVRRNRVMNTGSTGKRTFPDASGISAVGDAITIDDNEVDGVVSDNRAVAITAYGLNNVLSNNRVSRLAESGAVGCAFDTIGHAALRGNSVIAKSASADGFCTSQTALLVDNVAIVGGEAYRYGAFVNGRNF